MINDSVDDLARPALVASVEPSVVFSSLAAHCVPELCDGCTIDIVDGPRARYRIVYPPPHAGSGDLPCRADHAGSTPDPGHRQLVRVPFAHRRFKQASDDGPRHENQGEFHGVATFEWHRRTPTRGDRTMAVMLTDQAVHTVVWQRGEQATSAALAKVAHLQVALESNRHIGAAVGILISLHKITQDQAFDLLRTASQHCHRKLRDLALDVIDTGWLDPALLPGSPQRLGGEHGAGEDLGDDVDGVPT